MLDYSKDVYRQPLLTKDANRSHRIRWFLMVSILVLGTFVALQTFKQSSLSNPVTNPVALVENALPFVENPVASVEIPVGGHLKKLDPLQRVILRLLGLIINHVGEAKVRGILAVKTGGMSEILIQLEKEPSVLFNQFLSGLFKSYFPKIAKAVEVKGKLSKLTETDLTTACAALADWGIPGITPELLLKAVKTQNYDELLVAVSAVLNKKGFAKRHNTYLEQWYDEHGAEITASFGEAIATFGDLAETAKAYAAEFGDDLCVGFEEIGKALGSAMDTCVVASETLMQNVSSPYPSAPSTGSASASSTKDKKPKPSADGKEDKKIDPSKMVEGPKKDGSEKKPPKDGSDKNFLLQKLIF